MILWYLCSLSFSANHDLMFVQRHQAVTANLLSKQLLFFYFARQQICFNP